MFNVIITLLVVFAWYVLVPEIMFQVYKLKVNPSYFKMSVYDDVIKNEFYIRLLLVEQSITNRFYRIFMFMYRPILIGMVYIKSLQDVMSNSDIQELEDNSILQSKSHTLTLKHIDAVETMKLFNNTSKKQTY